MKKNMVRILTLAIIIIITLTFGSSIALAESSSTDAAGTETVGAVDNPVQDAEYWLKMKTMVQWNGLRNCDCEVTRGDWPVIVEVPVAPAAPVNPAPGEGDDPIGGDPIGGDPTGGDPVANEPVFGDWTPTDNLEDGQPVYERKAPCPNGTGNWYYEGLYPDGSIYRSGYDSNGNLLKGPDLVSTDNGYPPD